jgi:transcriptional regulator GlxA family with amidase domain
MENRGVFDDLTIAVVAFEGAEELDVIGRYEIFWWMSVFQGYPPDYKPTEDEFRKTFVAHEGAMPNVFTVGPRTSEAYKLSSGTRFIPQYSYADAPKANVVLVPGGHGSLRFPELQRDGTLDYIRSVATAPDNKYIMSVCSGAFVLGTLGLLDEPHCTVNHTLYALFEKRVPKARLIKDASLSFVQDGKLITGNAPASGIPAALRLVEYHCGPGYKNNLRNLLAYVVPPVAGAVAEGGLVKHVTL